MKKNVAARGKARVAVGSHCRKKKHGRCSVQDCCCKCHEATVK